MLQETTGKSFTVRALVLYPGWFVKTLDRGNGEVVVLNPKQLSSFLEKCEVKLCHEDIQLATYHLSRHIRVSAKTLKQV